MTDKELRRLNRSELLQMLIGQMEENKALKEKLALAESKLQDRQIKMEKAGTMAEATLLLNGVLEATEAAAQQYLENIKRMSSEQDAVCREMKEKAERESEEIMQRARSYREKVRVEADNYWKQVIDKASNLLSSQAALQEAVLSARKKENL